METEEKAKPEVPFLYVLPCGTMKNNHSGNSWEQLHVTANPISQVSEGTVPQPRDFVSYKGGTFSRGSATINPHV